jgi:hypothetical protein
MRGNDAIRESIKAVCQVPIAEPIRTESGVPLDPDVPPGPAATPLFDENIKRYFARRSESPNITLAKTLYRPLTFIVDQYIQFLRNQGSPRWRSIPPELINRIERFYPEVNLHQVRFATGIKTVHGHAIAIGDEVFFPRDIDLNHRDNLKLLYHELEHVAQYRRRGGVHAFFAEYIARIPGKIIAERSFQIHDRLDMEQAAISKAENVISAVPELSGFTPSLSPVFRTICNTPLDRCGVPFSAQSGQLCGSMPLLSFIAGRTHADAAIRETAATEEMSLGHASRH